MLCRSIRRAKAALVFARLFHVIFYGMLHCHYPGKPYPPQALSRQTSKAEPQTALSAMLFFVTMAVPLFPAVALPPFLTFAHYKCSEMEEKELYKRYFRKKDPACRPEEIEWIEMSDEEFYRFITSQEGEGRYFIDINNAVLETTKDEARVHRAEKDRSDYLREQEAKYITLSLQQLEEDGCSGIVFEDKSQDVESDAIALTGANELIAALNQLDAESYALIHSLYLDVEKKTERQMASLLGVSQAAINKRKKKILKTLKSLVIKIQKSSQYRSERIK